MTTISARKFNQDVSAAKRAADNGPVVITDRGRPSHVLLSIGEYERLTGVPDNMATWLAMDEDIDFEPAPLSVTLRVPDLGNA